MAESDFILNEAVDAFRFIEWQLLTAFDFVSSYLQLYLLAVSAGVALWVLCTLGLAVRNRRPGDQQKPVITEVEKDLLRTGECLPILMQTRYEGVDSTLKKIGQPFWPASLN